MVRGQYLSPNVTGRLLTPCSPWTPSLGLEVLEAVPDPDVVVVCCGGGGLLAGVAAALRLSGSSRTRIYGVEPEGGRTSSTSRTTTSRTSSPSMTLY